MPTKPLPKRLKVLRAHLRAVHGRGDYARAHEYAERVWNMERERRRHAKVPRCPGCGFQVAEPNQLCGECACENDGAIW